MPSSRPRDDVDVAPFIESATACGVLLVVIELRGQTLKELYGASLLLVRPAWRGASVDQSMTAPAID